MKHKINNLYIINIIIHLMKILINNSKLVLVIDYQINLIRENRYNSQLMEKYFSFLHSKMRVILFGIILILKIRFKGHLVVLRWIGGIFRDSLRICYRWHLEKFRILSHSENILNMLIILRKLVILKIVICL